MALSDPRVIFGVHSATPYSRTDGTPYGIAKVLGGSSFSLTGELVKLVGGSNRYNWAVEESTIEAEISLKTKSYEDFLFTLFLGKAPTANAAETTGSATTIANKKGTSVVAATGILTTSLKTGSSADLKFGKYVIVVASATTVNVYFSSDADIKRGADGTYQNDALKVTASALTVVQNAAVAVPNFGLELTGGAGTIGMTIGDTATFEVRPVNTKSMDVVIGAATDTFPEFGMIMMAKKRGNEELFEVDAYRCKGVGMPIGMEESAFGEAELKAAAFYDSTLDAVAKIRHVSPA